MMVFVDKDQANGLCHVGIISGADTLWAPFIIVDEVVRFSILMMEEFGYWDDAVH